MSGYWSAAGSADSVTSVVVDADADERRGPVEIVSGYCSAVDLRAGA